MKAPLVSWNKYLPDEVAIEAPFYGKNVQSMLKLGRAQGVAMAAVLARDIPVFEYAPRKIKLSITSAGDASKEQVAGMLARMFNLQGDSKKPGCNRRSGSSSLPFLPERSEPRKSRVQRAGKLISGRIPGRVK